MITRQQQTAVVISFNIYITANLIVLVAIIGYQNRGEIMLRTDMVDNRDAAADREFWAFFQIYASNDLSETPNHLLKKSKKKK